MALLSIPFTKPWTLLALHYVELWIYHGMGNIEPYIKLFYPPK